MMADHEKALKAVEKTANKHMRIINTAVAEEAIDTLSFNFLPKALTRFGGAAVTRVLETGPARTFTKLAQQGVNARSELVAYLLEAGDDVDGLPAELETRLTETSLPLQLLVEDSNKHAELTETVLEKDRELATQVVEWIEAADEDPDTIADLAHSAGATKTELIKTYEHGMYFIELINEHKDEMDITQLVAVPGRSQETIWSFFLPGLKNGRERVLEAIEDDWRTTTTNK